MQSQDLSKKPNPIMFEVESSNIRMLGYDKEAKLLRIKFVGSTFYDFRGVPPELYLKFIGAESKGRFFFTRIKGKFDMEKQE